MQRLDIPDDIWQAQLKEAYNHVTVDADKARQRVQELYQLAVTQGTPSMVYSAMQALGILHINVKEYLAAIPYFKKAAIGRWESGNVFGYCSSVSGLSRCYREAGKWYLSEIACEHIIAYIAGNEKEQLMNGHAYKDLMMLDFLKGEHVKALQNGMKAMDVFLSLADYNNLTPVTLTVAGIYSTLNDNDKAIETFLSAEQQLRLCQPVTVSVLRNLVVTKVNLCELFLKTNQPDKAKLAIGAAEKIITEHGINYQIDYLYLCKGELYKTQNKLPLAYLNLQRSLRHMDKNNEYVIIQINMSLAEILIQYGKVNKALQYLHTAEKLNNTKPVPHLELLLCRQLAKAYQMIESYHISNTYLLRLVELMETEYHQNRTKQVSELQAKFEIAEKQHEAQRLRTEIAEYNLRLLRSQMNPHFIFNSINSINNYILKNESDTASGYLLKFAQLMRQILDNSSQTYVTLQKEIDFLENYLLLEQLRFNTPFDYQIIIGNGLDTTDVKIPPMLLQPYIENAVWHGLAHKSGSGKIVVEFTETTNTLFCRIEDNGVGRIKSKELLSPQKKHESKGLHITEERITKGLNGSVNVIDLYSDDRTPIGTRVEVNIPL